MFFSYIGTNVTLQPQLLERIGGKRISDPNGRTLFLQCRIPSEAVDPTAMVIHFMFSEYCLLSTFRLHRNDS